jgi:transcriptional regulator with XRE-family HTH domain
MNQDGLGARVRAMREALGLTQEQLAARGRIGRLTVLRVESGANKATSHAVRAGLAVAFGLTLDDSDALLDGQIGVRAALGRAARKVA